MKKLFLCCMVVMCMFTSFCYATSNQIDAYINKKIKVYYQNELFAFKNVNDEPVYPITYEGTTYLPVRALSSLFNIGIMWDGNNNSIYLGGGKADKSSAYKIVGGLYPEALEHINPLLNKDIKIYFESELQRFFDANNQEVFPISYNGTTYLPIRAVSTLFNLNIDWNAETNSIYIVRKDVDDVIAENITTIYETKEFKEYKENHADEVIENYNYIVQKLNYTDDIELFTQYSYYNEYLSEMEYEIEEQVINLEKELQILGIDYTSYAQLYYMIINDLSIEEAIEQKVFDYNVPANDNTFVIPKEVFHTIGQINEDAYKKYDEETGEDIFSEYELITNKYQKEIAAYEIKGDIKYTNSINESLKLYDGDYKLYITSNGFVFSLPGFEMNLGKSLKAYDINDSGYFLGKIPKKLYENDIFEEDSTVHYSKKLPLRNLQKFKALKYDGNTHLIVLGYSFYNWVGHTTSDLSRMMKDVNEWNTDGLYKCDSLTGEKYIIVKNDDETFDVYYFQSDELIGKYENIIFDGELNIIDDYEKINIDITLSYDVIYVQHSSERHSRESTFTRIKDITAEDMKKYE